MRREFGYSGVVSAKVVKSKEEEADKYRDYFDFVEPLRRVSSHRLLAVRRGEEEGFLKVDISPDADDTLGRLVRIFVHVKIIDETSVRQGRAVNMLHALHFGVPIYISLDKDVLSRENIITNWSNGSLSLPVLCLMLKDLIRSNSLLGVDVCGGTEISDPVTCRQIIELNNRCDEMILSVLYGTKKASDINRMLHCFTD